MQAKWIDGQCQVFTTGQAAQVCRVSIQTMIRAVDRGLVRGHRIPGLRRPRRIPRAELVRFMASFGVLAGLLPAWEAQNSPAAKALRRMVIKLPHST